VADGSGEVATVEFIGGEMVVHRGAELPVAALTNSMYEYALAMWIRYRDDGQYSWMNSSFQRFCLAADRVSSFTPTAADEAITAAFDALHEIRGERFSQHASQWSIVFDPKRLRAVFKTLEHPELRHVDLTDFELRCGAPVQMLDIQEQLSGDVFGSFFDFSFEMNYDHHAQFLWDWGIPFSPVDLLRMLEFITDYPCVMTHSPARRVVPAAP
jgi:hypothetical protein